MKRSILLCVCLSFCTIINQAQTVTDYDGNTYNTVNIGTQVWLKENLKVTHFRNGTAIPNVTNLTSWAGLSTPARCYYNNDSVANDSVYGALYNWYAINNVNQLCPEGWHVPTDAEWTEVETFLGGAAIAGGKMKEAGFMHWNSPNTGATNESGFTGLPGGMLGVNYTFQTINENGLWWTSTSYNSSYAWSRYLWYLNSGVDRNPTPKTIGLSVRCIKDIGVGVGKLRNDKNIKIYPNPTSNKLFVDCSEHQSVELEVSNLAGEILIRRVLSDNMNEIDLSYLSDGIYIVKLSCDSWTIFKKLIKE
jgi:uncharacterized protein (TIGR02145 family)